jgi:hypothetical protein
MGDSHIYTCGPLYFGSVWTLTVGIDVGTEAGVTRGDDKSGSLSPQAGLPIGRMPHRIHIIAPLSKTFAIHHQDHTTFVATMPLSTQIKPNNLRSLLVAKPQQAILRLHLYQNQDSPLKEAVVVTIFRKWSARPPYRLAEITPRTNANR